MAHRLQWHFLKKGVPTMKQSAMVKLLAGSLLLAISSMAQAQAGGDAAAGMLKALEGYKNGSRSHPSMDAIAVTLTAQDMKDLVAHYTSGGR
jgi:hypothetical protein